MRNVSKRILTIAPAVLVLTGCANIHHLDSTKLTNISVSDGAPSPEKWGEVGEQIAAGKEIVIKIPAGRSLPIKLTLVLPMTKLVAGQNELLFTRDTYLFVSKSKMRISPDGQRWADAYDFKAMEKLFGFEKGALTVGFEATKQERGVILLGAESK